MTLCDDHKDHINRIENNSKRLDENRSDHKDLWSAIKEKLAIKIFYILVIVIIGNFGFQLAIYDAIKTVDKKVAVIETKINNGGYVKKVSP